MNWANLVCGWLALGAVSWRSNPSFRLRWNTALSNHQRLEKRIAQLEGQAKPQSSRRMPGRPKRTGSQHVPRTTQTPASRLCPIPHDAHPPSGACGGAVSRLRDPLVRRLGPAHSGGHRPAPGSGAGNRARLPGPHLSTVPTLLCSQSTTGRRGDGQAASGGPLIAALREEARLQHHPMVPGHRARAAPQPGPIVNATRPWRAKRRPNWRAYWSASAAAQWSTPMRPAGVKTDSTATCGLSAPPTSGTSCGVVGARPWSTKSWARSCWRAGQATSMPHHHYDGPKQRCGLTCCGTYRPGVLYDVDHWPRLTPSTNSTVRPRFTHPSEPQRRTAQLTLERRLLALCRPFRDDPSAVARLCRRMEKHIKELFAAAGQQCRRAQPAPFGGQPQGQRGHPLSAGHRHQDDAGLNLRHLASTSSQPHRCLPSTAHFPSTLNCYQVECYRVRWRL